MGGAALYVESILENALTPESRPGIDITGNLQPVMKESTQIAYSFAKSVLAKQFPENKFFEKAKLHMHCPEGAVPKDGKLKKFLSILLFLHGGLTSGFRSICRHHYGHFSPFAGPGPPS